MAEPLGPPPASPPGRDSVPAGSGSPFVASPPGRGRKVMVIGAAVAIVAVAVAIVVATGNSDTDDDLGQVRTANSVISENVAPPPDVDPTTSTVDEPDPVSLLTEAGIEAIVDEIATARGADPLQMYSMVVYPEYLFAQVQDPAITENVDEYEWRTQLEAPTPVRLVSVDDLEARLYVADDVVWSEIPSLVDRATSALDIDQGEATHVIVHRPIPFSNDIRMRVFVTGPRTSGFVDADASGLITSINGE